MGGTSGLGSFDWEMDGDLDVGSPPHLPFWLGVSGLGISQLGDGDMPCLHSQASVPKAWNGEDVPSTGKLSG